EVSAEEQGARTRAAERSLGPYMNKNASRFLLPATVSFEQIFFDNAGTRANVERAIAAARVAVARGADPSKLGQASLLPGRVENTAQDLVARDFGVEFAQQVETA